MAYRFGDFTIISFGLSRRSPPDYRRFSEKVNIALHLVRYVALRPMIEDIVSRVALFGWSYEIVGRFNFSVVFIITNLMF